MASDVPVKVTARSVEFGNISLATWIEHPVTSLISLIFDPPLPTVIVGVIDDVADIKSTTKKENEKRRERREKYDEKIWNSFSKSL